MAKNKVKTSKQSVSTSPKRKAYYAQQFYRTEENLKRKGKTNKKKKFRK